MKRFVQILKEFNPRYFSVISKSRVNMEELLKEIFIASVNSVKPNELITKNKLIKLSSESGREYFEIKQRGNVRKFDVTDKRIQLGKN